MKSTIHSDVAIDTAPIVVNEITLVGSRCGRFEPALKMAGAAQRIKDEVGGSAPATLIRPADIRAMAAGSRFSFMHHSSRMTLLALNAAGDW